MNKKEILKVKILGYLKQNLKGLTGEELALFLNGEGLVFSKPTFYAALKELEREGRITRERRGMPWRVTL